MAVGKLAEPTRRYVEDELAQEAGLDPSAIAVNVEEGSVATLFGRVRSERERLVAEACARRVPGVRAVVNELSVIASTPRAPDDREIAKAALVALDHAVEVPAEKIQIVVAAGHITLEGEVEAAYQRDAAKGAVAFLEGVTGVTDRIEVVLPAPDVVTPAGGAEGPPPPTRMGVRSEILAAFQRIAASEADRIRIEVSGRTVALHGTVRSVVERDEAEQASWAAPGVESVENHLQVDPHMKGA